MTCLTFQIWEQTCVTQLCDCCIHCIRHRCVSPVGNATALVSCFSSAASFLPCYEDVLWTSESLSYSQWSGPTHKIKESLSSSKYWVNMFTWHFKNSNYCICPIKCWTFKLCVNTLPIESHRRFDMHVSRLRPRMPRLICWSAGYFDEFYPGGGWTNQTNKQIH